MSVEKDIARLDARYAETINPRASLGFLGLATDRASLPDFLDFIAPLEGIGVHSTRIPFTTVATPETLATMAGGLADGARMLVPGQPLDSISYSCTSGTIAIGEERVVGEIQGVRAGVPVVTPIGAAIAGLRELGCHRISMLVPYLIETSEMVADHFETEGFAIDRLATFDLGGDPEMNRFDPARIFEAGVEVCDVDSDALFVSCTGWRTFPVVESLETALGKPVITSNQALAWKAVRVAGIDEPLHGRGRLLLEL